MRFFVLCFTFALFAINQAAFAKSTPVKKTGAAAVANEDDTPPNIKQSAAVEYHCEMNDALTIYTNADDNEHIGLHWKTHIYRLTRIATSTGANRFENKKIGLVWIGIPSKGMLLDSKHGQQLANDCKTAVQ